MSGGIIWWWAALPISIRSIKQFLKFSFRYWTGGQPGNQLIGKPDEPKSVLAWQNNSELFATHPAGNGSPRNRIMSINVVADPYECLGSACNFARQ